MLASLILSPFLAWSLATVGLAPPGLILICGFIGGPIGFLLLPELGQETRLVTCSMSTVTARTLTGERTVDLRRVTSVRLHTGFGRGRIYRALVVRDEDGVCLGLTTVRSQRALKRALQRIPADTSRGPSVSMASRALMDLAPHGHLVAHTVTSFLLHVVVLALYVVAVLQLAGG
ncbi:hypothetical protein [Streptomyces sp. NPDC047024]|uniref:hypothetical protein n=1 Tax=Streptomyces sp. NPDC047024 TaxID=3155476 RepID=UPI0033C8B07C